MAAAILVLAGARLSAQPRPTIDAHAAADPPRIDGVIGETEWGEPIAAGDWLSYNPLHGDSVPQHTTVWISYDADALYFAFRCDDPEPGGIKTSITRRDNIWQDDWIGLSLDALGTGQLSYHMMVNPNGVQARHDQQRRGPRGFGARLDLGQRRPRSPPPATSSRFGCRCRASDSRAARTRAWGILFWRRVSRLGVSVAWPALAPGVWVFERHAALGFVGPAAAAAARTAAERHLRADRDARRPRPRGRVVGNSEFGFSGKIGLGPTITLDATVNPDFSQVESDTFQVEVNQRFPTFFGEKRPFFMEGAGIFALAGSGNGDNSLRTAVHTRRIVDPIFGAKLTGNAGRFTFGTLSSVDEAVPANALRSGRGKAAASSTSPAPSTASARATTPARSPTDMTVRRRLQPRRRRGSSLAAGRVAAGRGICARVADAGGPDATRRPASARK